MKIQIGIITAVIIISSCAAPATATTSPTSAVPPSSTPSQNATGTVSTSTPWGMPHFEPFGKARIETAETNFNVKGSGRNVDSISFWEAPDSSKSMMIVTSKGNESIEVYQYPFTTELTTISCGQASNGIWVDQDRDVLYITERNSSNICAFDLPGLEKNNSLSFTTAATGKNSEPNLTLLALPDGQRRIYISYDDTVFYHDAETGKSLGKFVPSKGLETMYGDDYYQVLYIPDENGRSGVYMYDPDGNPLGKKFGDRSIFNADEEGIWVYKCLSGDTEDHGEGLIVVSDQKEDITDFEVFNRKTKEYLGTLNISGVSNTDGISITQQASPDYPLGLLAVIANDKSTVGVGWDTIFEKTGLSCGN